MTVPSISGRTRLFPIIGNPVAQVRAPAVFNRLFALAGIDAVSFGIALPPETVAATCEALLASPSVGGLLVTVPYKKTLRAICQRVGREAELTGAANALRRDADGVLHGDLFDGAGFLAGLRAAGHEPAGQRVLLLGAGGAGSAIASALAQAGVAQLSIYDPQQANARQLASHMQAAFPQVRFDAPAVVDVQGCAIVINASPLGLKPADALPLDPARLAAGTLVCDIIMEPADTALLRAARERGLPTHAGRAMLDYQLPAYLRFFGFEELAQRVRIAGDEITLAD